MVADLAPNIDENRRFEGNVGKQRHSVLVVDDDEGLRGLLKVILSEQYDVKTASNGCDALDVVEHESLDVIVLDLRMPVMDGPGFFRELRSRGDCTPILLASSNGARVAQRELGAEGAIEKPFEPDALLQAVGDLIH